MSSNDNASRIIAASFRAEDAAVVRLLELLREANDSLRKRLQDPGTQGRRETIEGMLTAVQQTADRVRVSLLAGMDDATAQAVANGVQLAQATLPQGAVQFGISDELLRAVGDYQATLIGGLTDELRTSLAGQIQLGMLAGLPTEEIGTRLVSEGLEGFHPWQSAEQRAETIVRTELNRVTNLATMDRYRAAAELIPGLRKKWLTAGDGRVRESHRALNGVEKGMDELFDVGGFEAMHPHDPRLPARESVMCRCRLLSVVPE